MRASVFLCLLGLAVAVPDRYVWDNTGTQSNDRPEHVCLVDQGSCGCCLMQKQMNKMKAFFKTSLDEVQKDLHDTQNSLNDTIASRTAFSVALTNQRWCMGPDRDDRIIDYKHVFLNLGNAYSVTTGKFTVAHSGLYILTVTVYSDAGGPGNTLKACARLEVNGQVMAAVNDNNMQDQEDSGTIVFAQSLTAGDVVAVVLPTGCFLCDNNSHFNTFSGFLLVPTEVRE